MNNKINFFIVIAGMLCINLCISTPEAAGDRDKVKEEGQQQVVETYLDTLNRGKEVSLIRDDISTGLSEKKDAPPAGKKILPEGYRIQVLALTSMEAARAKKSAIESKLQLDVYIDFDKPYYKMYVGNYTSRKDAEKALSMIKESGYPDAWIVKSKVFVDE
jgi:hypothetical protein